MPDHTAFYLAGLLALSPPLLAAGDTAENSEFFGEFPVVLSASRLVHPLNEAPAAVTVIDRETIRASGVRELADIFRLVPGMTVGRLNGHSPAMGFHGFSSGYFRQFQVLVDGVSIYNPLWGGTAWGELPFALDDIERIEVVRGPNAATYGANSFLGVVNIITRDPATDAPFETTINSGKYGVADITVRHALTSGDWRYRISAGQRADRGLGSLPDDRRSEFLNLRSHYRINTADELKIQFGYAGGMGEEGVYPDLPTKSNGPRPGLFRSNSLQLRWTRAQGADDEVWVQFSHAERQLHEVRPYKLFGVIDYPLSYSYDHRRTDIELQHTFRVDEGLRGVWGAQAREDGARSPTYFYTNDWLTSRLLRLFGNLEWRPAADWLAHAGAMFEHNTVTGSAVSPSLALVHHLTPKHTLRARIAKARRTPTLYEDRINQRYDYPPGTLISQSALTTAELSDEKILSRELAYLGEYPALRMNLDVRLFHDQIKDILVTDSSSPPGFRNSEYANLRGAGFDLRWRPWSGAHLTFTGSRTVIVSDKSDIVRSAPLHTASALFRQELPADTSVSLGYYRVGSMHWIGVSSTDVLPAFDRVDVRLAKRFRWGGHKAELSWVTQNTFDAVPVFRSTDLDRRTSWLRLQYEY
ncbi:MAG: TonB-dependent receptor [Rhodocyclaceae bacterium]|nr:TonB-dependent receptor [Rhodocyclaceae bacterium]